MRTKYIENCTKRLPPNNDVAIDAPTFQFEYACNSWNHNWQFFRVITYSAVILTLPIPV